MTLTSVLVAVALLGILALVMTALFGNMSDTMLRSGVVTEEEQIVHQVETVLKNPNLCSWALHTTAWAAGAYPGQDVVWNWNGGTPSVTLDHIEIAPGGAAGAPGARQLVLRKFAGPGPDPLLPPDLTVTSITLRLPRQDAIYQEGLPTFSKLSRKEWNAGTSEYDSVQYDVTNAKLALQFAAVNGRVAGGTALKEVDIDVSLAKDPATNKIMFCNTGQNVQAVNFECNATTTANQPSIPDRKTCAPAAGSFPCAAMYFVKGFDAKGNPICDCKVTCVSDPIYKGP